MKKIFLLLVIFLIGSISLSCESDINKNDGTNSNAEVIRNDVEVDDNSQESEENQDAILVNYEEDTSEEIESFTLNPETFSELRVFCSNNKYGYIDRNGNVIIEPEYAYAYDFIGNFAIVAGSGDTIDKMSIGNFGLIFKDGSVVIKPTKDQIRYFDDSSIIVTEYEYEKETLLSLEGEVLYEGEIGTFDAIGRYSEGYATVTLNGLKGYLDTNKQVVIEPIFKYAGPFKNGIARVSIEVKDKYGVDTVLQNAFINYKGEIIYGPYDYMWYYTEGLALIEIDGKYGFIDDYGDVVIGNVYADAYPFSEGLAGVDSDGDGFYGFIDMNGKLVIEEDYDYVRGFNEGYAVVTSKIGQYLIINKKGEWMNEMNTGIQSIWPFSEGLARVYYGSVHDSKVGYVDYNFNTVIPFDFDYATDFKDGLAVVSYNGVSFSIDRDGNRIND